MRLLESAKIEYLPLEYEVDENDLSGVHVAKELGQPPEQVFKTLVLKGERTGFFVCCIPVDKELDLKKAAKAAHDKKAEMLPLKDLLPTTGYIRGGCSPVGMKKQFVTTYHETAQNNPVIMVSGGKIGTQVECKPDDLLKITRGQYADICKE